MTDIELEEPLETVDGHDRSPMVRHLSAMEHRPISDSEFHWVPSRSAVKGYLRSKFPPLDWVPRYNRIKFGKDVIAGVTLTVMLIPQSVAYALLAGLTPEYGIYATAIPLFVYALLGTSRELNVGPVAIASLVSAQTMEDIGLRTCDVSQCLLAPPIDDIACQLCQQAQQTYSEASVLLALFAGLLQVALGVLHLGVLASFLAQPVITGFNMASAVLIAGSQLKSVFGVRVPNQPTIFHTIYHCIRLAFFDNLINWPALVVWIIATAILYAAQTLTRRLKTRVPIPGPLIVVVLGTLVSWLAQLETPVVGVLPGIFPRPAIPVFALWREVLPGSALAAFVALIGSLSLSQLFARKNHYDVDASQELFALGMASSVGAFFSSFIVTGSLSRSVVADGAGAATQFYGVVNGVLCLLFGFAMPLLRYLPQAVFAAIIILSCVPLLKFDELLHLWRVDKRDCFTMALTVAVTLLLGVDIGLLLSISVSVLLFVYQASSVRFVELGLVRDTDDVFKDVARFSGLHTFDDVTILRFDAPLFFANVKHFEQMLSQRARAYRNSATPHAIVIDCSSMTSCDSTAAFELQRILCACVRACVRDMTCIYRKEYADVGKRVAGADARCLLLLAALKGGMRDRLRRAGVDVDAQNFGVTIRDCVDRLSELGLTPTPPWHVDGDK